MKTSRLIAGLMITSLSLSATGIALATPSTPPTGASTTNVNGIFADYFENLATTCATGLVTGFDSTTSSTYLTPTCTPTKTLLAALFSTFGLGSATNIVFSPDGTPKNLITASASQWGDVVGGIAYTGGSVSIGTSALDGKLHIAGGKVSLGEVTEDFLPGSTNWKYNLQLNGIDNTSIGFHDSMASVSSIRYNNAGFVIGGDDGWGVKNVSMPGNVTIGGTLNGRNISDFLHPNIPNTLSTNYVPKMGDQSIDKNNMKNSNIYDDGTNVGIGTTTLGEKLTVNGNVQASGFIYTSDRRLKDNIAPLSDSLEKILSLNGYSFDWKSTGAKDIGVIAQEVEAVYPELVHTNNAGYKSVEYGNLIAPLIEAIKTQQKEIEALKTEVEALKK